MGLTLNSSSLTLEAVGGGAAAAGLSEADVNTLIKAKTEWTLIETIDVSGVNAAEFDVDATYTTYKVASDQAFFTGHYVFLQFKSGSTVLGNEYRNSMWRGKGSSSGYVDSGSWNGFHITSYEAHDNIGTYEWIINNLESGKRATARWHYGGGNNGNQGAVTIGGGIHNNTSLVDGFKVNNPNGSWTSGKFNLYGMN
jgi:hypothetical protein